MLPMLISAAGTVEASGGDSIWTSVTTVVGNFLNDVLTPVSTFVTSNPIALIFLGISFVGIGIKYLKRVTYAFGRGR